MTKTRGTINNCQYLLANFKDSSFNSNLNILDGCECETAWLFFSFSTQKEYIHNKMRDILLFNKNVKPEELKGYIRVFKESNYNESINNVFCFVKNLKMKTFKMIIMIKVY